MCGPMLKSILKPKSSRDTSVCLIRGFTALSAILAVADPEGGCGGGGG